MRRLLDSAFPVAIAAGLLAGGALARDDGEARNMKVVGVNDLQARSTYQPTVHKQGGRYILYAGHHPLAGPGEGLGGPGTLPSFNPLTGRNEENGTSIVDVTDPRRPRYLFHLPVPNGTGGGAQMVRV